MFLCVDIHIHTISFLEGPGSISLMLMFLTMGLDSCADRALSRRCQGVVLIASLVAVMSKGRVPATPPGPRPTRTLSRCTSRLFVQTKEERVHLCACIHGKLKMEDECFLFGRVMTAFVCCTKFVLSTSRILISRELVLLERNLAIIVHFIFLYKFSHLQNCFMGTTGVSPPSVSAGHLWPFCTLIAGRSSNLRHRRFGTALACVGRNKRRTHLRVSAQNKVCWRKVLAAIIAIDFQPSNRRIEKNIRLSACNCTGCAHQNQNLCHFQRK